VAHGDGSVPKVDDLDGVRVAARLGLLVVVVAAVHGGDRAGCHLLDVLFVRFFVHAHSLLRLLPLVHPYFACCACDAPRGSIRSRAAHQSDKSGIVRTADTAAVCLRLPSATS
jgi:hypothetical protein